jgi:hypothetical protein
MRKKKILSSSPKHAAEITQAEVEKALKRMVREGIVLQYVNADGETEYRLTGKFNRVAHRPKRD